MNKLKNGGGVSSQVAQVVMQYGKKRNLWAQIWEDQRPRDPLKKSGSRASPLPLPFPRGATFVSFSLVLLRRTYKNYVNRAAIISYSNLEDRTVKTGKLLPLCLFLYYFYFSIIIFAADKIILKKREYASNPFFWFDGYAPKPILLQ